MDGHTALRATAISAASPPSLPSPPAGHGSAVTDWRRKLGGSPLNTRREHYICSPTSALYKTEVQQIEIEISPIVKSSRKRFALQPSAALPRLLPPLAVPDVGLAYVVQLLTVEDLLVVGAAGLVEHEPRESLNDLPPIAGSGIDHPVEEAIHIASHAIGKLLGLGTGFVGLLRCGVPAAVRDTDRVLQRALAIQHADFVDDRALDERKPLHESCHFIEASLEAIVAAQGDRLAIVGIEVEADVPM